MEETEVRMDVHGSVRIEGNIDEPTGICSCRFPDVERCGGGRDEGRGTDSGLDLAKISRIWGHMTPYVVATASVRKRVTLPTFPTFPFFLPTMAASSDGAWICVECGKVCKSCGGLSQHSSVHKRHPRIGETRNNSYRVYHAYLDGIFSPSSSFIRSNTLKENHAVQTESSSPLERRQRPHPQSPSTIGHLFHRALGSNSPRSCTPRLPSQITFSTNSSTFGALH